MALAILDFDRWEGQHAVFKIDIGTNGFYRFRIGSGRQKRAGVDVLENEASNTRLKKRADKGASYFDTGEEVTLPRTLFDPTNRYIQLVSCKDESGRAPALSKVVSVPVAFLNTSGELLDFNASMSVMPEPRFNTNRRLSHSHSFLSQQLSFEELLSSLVRTVLPAAITLLGGAGPAPGSGAAGSAPATPATANAIGSLINVLLRAVSGGPAPVSRQQSYSNGDYRLNRFTDPRGSQFSKPFIFGIDDALLASLAGPLLRQGAQLLPQLINAANQHKLETLRSNNQLMTTLNADVQRRLMLQQLLQNMPSAASGGSAMDEAQLLHLLQQLQPAVAAAPAATAPVPAPAPAAAPPAAPARAASFALSKKPVAFALSNSVIVSFINNVVQKWNGTDKLIYQKGKPVQFGLQLTVNPAPKTPLAKAIFRFVLKDAETQQTVFEKSIKQKHVSANTSLQFNIGAEELFQMPIQKPLSLFAEMRWRSASGKEYKAVGSEEVVFVENYFVKETGRTGMDERELTDLNTYRSFWNKVWESPVLNRGSRKKLWELDAGLRYSVFHSPEQESNGLLETKMQLVPDDADSIKTSAFGKLKSGIELSIPELNKLLSLWPGNQPLDNVKLQAIRNSTFSKNSAREMVTSLNIKGREGERGLVWAIPTFRLLDVTLCRVAKTAESGQVAECTEEKVFFPVPASIRILGLKSKKE